MLEMLYYNNHYYELFMLTVALEPSDNTFK